ncbi:KICSTOR complex protein SZT2 isoform X2 [Microcaecilia unicolor]|uniref:KICSTOR complex protein SZT2 isoform X2 n=1 Tax=Microcaecilia unicolor TaxID=1415580 RepID=A0A6P7YE22_9AMPH|nr:KICSTOR complex protein SZT2 isoform X2 [Microcaecilia unicolor]
MKKDYRISRNVRLAWFLSNLHQIISPMPESELLTSDKEVDVVSVLPNGWQMDEPMGPKQYLLLPSSQVTFLARQYRFVIELDLSPSTGIVDDSTGEIIFDEVFHALSRCLNGLIRAFHIPGSDIVYQPEIFVTIQAYSSIIGLQSHQVLIQGCQLDGFSLEDFLHHIYTQLGQFESRVAEVLQQQYELNNQVQAYPLSEDSPTDYAGTSADKKVGVSIVTADIGLVSMIRQGILALQLLPTNSSAGIIIITDGVTSVPDVAVCETLLNQLRSGTVACSFVQVGGVYSYDCSFGHVPNVELMKFIAMATFGSYLSSCPEIDDGSLDMNVYHKSFLLYSFLRTGDSLNPEYYCVSQHKLFNEHLISASSNPALALRRKKHTEKEVHADLVSVVSVRLREGYSIREISLAKGESLLEVKLVLLWKHNMRIEYLAVAAWPLDPSKRSTSVEVTMEGSYDILHDISCTMRKPITSLYRTSVIRRFWNTLQSINQTDQMLVHLQSFDTVPEHFTIPESTKNGVPLFYIPPGSTAPVLSLQHSASDSTHSQFASYWKPVLSMDANFWQRWLHMHRIVLLLEHDTPVPKHLHTPGNNGRYSTIQCRISHSALTSLLRDWSSFVLVEGYSYVKLMYSSSDISPSSFYVVRIISKAPCMVLRLGFPIGTPAQNRNQIIEELRDQILQLRFPNRVHSKEATPKVKRKVLGTSSPSKSPPPEGSHCAVSNRPCLVVLQKPLDKLLIRYEKLPLDYRTPFILSLENFGQQLAVSGPTSMAANRTASSTLSSLFRYFYHQRWIWCVQSGLTPTMPITAVGQILATLTEIRLSEGFHFASSGEGIVNMVLELPIQTASMCENRTEKHSCIVQYILFPPHATSTKDSFSTDDDNDTEVEAIEVDTELNLVTECWVEPQSGHVISSAENCKHLQGLQYADIPKALYPRDLSCISTLLTFECVSQLCQNKERGSPVFGVMGAEGSYVGSGQRIYEIPFHFDLMTLLPKCQQIEMCFLTLTKEDDGIVSDSSSLPNDLLLTLFHGCLQQELSDREIPMADSDHVAVMEQILHRDEIGPEQRFLLPVIREEPLKASASLERKDNTMNFHTLLGNNEGTGSTSTLQSLCTTEMMEEDTLVEEAETRPPQWRCYARMINSQHVLLTFLPMTFSDVQKLMTSFLEKTSKDEGTEGESLEGAQIPRSPGKTTADMKQEMNCGTVPTLSVTPAHAGFREEPMETGGPQKRETRFSLNRQASQLDSSDANRVRCPVYVYSCSLETLREQLVSPRPERPFCDISFRSQFLERPSAVSWMEHRQKGLVNYCTVLQEHYHQCYVKALFKSLQQSQNVSSQDLLTAMDYCEEQLQEIDITSFLQMLCNHIRTFRESQAYGSQAETANFHVGSVEKGDDASAKKSGYLHSESSVEIEDYSNHEIHSSPCTVLPSEASIKPSNCCTEFPLSLLESGQPCGIYPDLHRIIQDKFLEIGSLHFKTVPSNPHYFFYCPPSWKKEDETSQEQQNRKQSEDLELSETELAVEEGNVSGCCITTESDPDLEVEYREKSDPESQDADSLSESSTVNQDDDSFSVLGGDSFNEQETLERDMPPLFIHLICSVTVRNQQGSMPISTLPTCLGEVISCLENSQFIRSIDLNDFTVTLDIYILTLPLEIEVLTSDVQHNRYTSDSSVTFARSPGQSSSLRSDEEMLHTLERFPSREEDRHSALSRLPIIQRQAIEITMTQIQWLLEDEIVSALRHSRFITTAILRKVANHVYDSQDHPNCRSELVLLQFVFGCDHSLEKFKEEFRRMNLPGYVINEEEDDYHFVSINRHQSVRHMCPVLSTPVSFQPPLGEAEAAKLRQDSRNSQNNQRKEDGDIILSGIQKEKSTARIMERRTESHQAWIEREESSSSHHSAEPESTMPADSSMAAEKDKVSEGISLADSSMTEKTSTVPHFPEDTETDQVEVETASPSEQWNSPTVLSALSQADSVPSLSHSSTVTNRQLPSRVQSLVSSQGSMDSDHLGYDGGSSDSEYEEAIMSDQDHKCPLMPDFWLIIKIHHDRVEVYSHTRSVSASQGVGKGEAGECLRLHQAVVRNINEMCRIVNQRLLLQDLHDSHVCNTLLVAESEEDIWKTETPYTSYRQRMAPSDDYSAEESFQPRDYLAATMQFMPGHFTCDVVWRTVIHIHPRLKMGPNMGVARAIQALRSVLNAFSIVNRKNMFVYQERSTKAVFYLRLSETSYSGKPWDTDGNTQPPVARSLALTRSQEPIYTEDVRGSRTSLEVSSSRGSDSARLVGQVDKHILLMVHGIGEAGPEITDELVKVLRRRLDEATLDIITVMLVRNCKLTPSDVEFIQPPGTPPTELLQFVLPQSCLPWLHLLAYYLRQNLQIFLHMPKYTDSNVEHHFQHYFHPHNVIPDLDIFLYNKPGGQGTGGKGIACIALSFLDEHGSPISLGYEHQNPFRLSFQPPIDLLHAAEFESLTTVNKFVPGAQPASSTLLRFDIWEKGNVSPLQLSERLLSAVRHALCDVVMEVRVLQAPLCVDTSSVISGSEFETGGNARLRRTVSDIKELVLSSASSHRRQPSPLHFSSVSSCTPGNSEPVTPSSKMARRSFWDMLSKPDGSELSAPKTTDDIVLERTEECRTRRRHKTESVKQSTSQERAAEMEQAERQAAAQRKRVSQLEEGDLGTLHPLFSHTCQQWMAFMSQLGCPSVQQCTVEMVSRFLLPVLLIDLSNLITSLANDTSVRVFNRVCFPQGESFVPFSVNQHFSSPPASPRHFILLGRNFHQWRYSSEQAHKGFQRFEAMELGLTDRNLDSSASVKDLVPRQRFLLINIVDKKLTLYTYNWSSDLGSTLTRSLTRLIQWQNARAHIVHCLITQKLGLFHHYCFSDTPWHEDPKQEPNPFLNSTLEVDTLIRSSTPPLNKEQSRLSSSSRSLPSLHFPPDIVPFDEALRDVATIPPVHPNPELRLLDAVSRHGAQFLDIKITERKEVEKQMKIENLFVTWQQRSAQSNMPISTVDLDTLKQSSRLVHFCATPLLFDPVFRQQIQTDQQVFSEGKKRHRSNDSAASGRDRSHSCDSLEMILCKLKEEPWLQEMCNTFMQHYIQYLQSMGFILVQVRPPSPTRSISSRIRAAASMMSEGRTSFSFPKQKSEGSPKSGGASITTYHLQRALPGGIILIELAFQGFYFCVKQYALECSRIPMGQSVNSQGSLMTRTLNKKFTETSSISESALSMLFTEECDKVRDLMHVHSFSYDFHLRIVHQYLLGSHMSLRQGYHLTSFLDDFIAHHPDIPKFGRNHVFQGMLVLATNMIGAHQLYNYIADHAKTYEMKPVRMSQPLAVGSDGKKMQSSDQNEYALVSVWNSSGSYKDSEGLRHHDDFDVSLLVCHSALPFEEQSEMERNILRLCFYVIMTSQRELFPRLTADMRRFKKLPRMQREALEPLVGKALWDTPEPGPHRMSEEELWEEVDNSSEFYPGSSQVKVGPGLFYSSPLFPLLASEVASAQKQLSSMVQLAKSHCRRDNLWKRLFLLEPLASDKLRLGKLSFSEVEELLEAVHCKSIAEIDKQLDFLLTMTVTWYQSLIKVLLSRFPQSCRHFHNIETGTQYLVVLNQKFTDCFVLVFLDSHLGKTSLKVVFREPFPEQPQNCESPLPQLVSTYHHLESVINAACFNLWTGLLS